tara:strand:+ start:4578 stop:5006 length:429 start_codon:yes stop_codon:yes gene_type:complete
LKRNYRNYTDADIIKHAIESKSVSQLLLKLKLRPVGGNYINIKRHLQRLDVDTKHWTGQGWSKDQRLKDWSKYTKAKNFKKHLVKIKGHSCEECKITEWNKKQLTLELDHVDGNRTNNNLENLKLLCPNCHSQTRTWRNRKQ